MKKTSAKLFNIKHFWMDLGRIVCFWMPLGFRIKKFFISNKAKEKIRGGAILVANHTCFFDPLILGCTVWYRPMFFLTAAVVMQNKLAAPFLKGMGCIEINRNICDMNAIRKAISVLSNGHLLTVFPQGGIDREDNMETIKSGVVLMGLRAKVPIIPVYIHKKDKTYKRNCVVIGEPITDHLPKDGGMPAITDVEKNAAVILEKMTKCRAFFEKELEEKKNGNS